MEYVIATVLVAICLIAVPYLLRKRTWKNLNQEIMENDFETFYYTLDSLKCQLSMSAYERENMRLSGYIAQDRKDDVETQLNMMLNMRIKKHQKLALYQRAFYYYIGQGRAKRTRDMIDLVQSIDPSAATDLEIQYSILIKKEAKYIDEIQERIDHLWDGKSEMDPSREMAVGTLEYLLGLQYSYKNDIEKMNEVFAQALKHCAGTPYEESIQKIKKEKA